MEYESNYSLKVKVRFFLKKNNMTIQIKKGCNYLIY